MRMPNINYIAFVFFICSFFSISVSAQKKEDPGREYISLRYYNVNNNIQYLVLSSQVRKNNQVRPQPNKVYDVYMQSSDPSNFIGKIKTDARGDANAVIPPALKALWDSSAQHIFIVKQGEDEVISDYTITRSQIILDTATADSVRTLTVKVNKWENGGWSPAPDVEMKVGIKRMGGIISAGDEDTYTTDSTGTVTVEMTKKGFPGDLKGNYIIAARVEDNDSYGNLLVEKTVPWGTVLKPDNSFFQTRALWSTRTRAPLWLLFMAYGIVISVWVTLIYLVILLVRIKKLGTAGQ
jgi:hypothetical protein